MKKAIILLHGLRSRNSDDFIQLIDYFKLKESVEVFNIKWFDNYDLETQKLDSINNLCKNIAKGVSDFDEIDIIGYSTGALLAKQIESYINNENNKPVVQIFLVAPLIKRYFLMGFFGAAKLNSDTNKELSILEKTLSSDEYENHIRNSKINKTFDLYMLKNFWMTEKLKLKYRGSLLDDIEIHWLLAENDFAIRTPEVYKILKKKGHKDIVVKNFSHGQIMKSQKDIFISWYEDKTNKRSEEN